MKAGLPMRSKLTWLIALISSFTPITIAQQKVAWTIVSTQEVDARIQRQVSELATQQGVPVRFLRQANKNVHPQTPHGPTITLEQMHDRTAFLNMLVRLAAGAPIRPTQTMAEEGYILRVAYNTRLTPGQITIKAISSSGFHHAILRVPDLLTISPSDLSSRVFPKFQSFEQDKNGDVIVADYPAFQMRGIIEGFYGPPWSHEDRLDVLRFQGQHGLNTFIYAPKDDPYHRKLWREPYPAEDMKQLRALAEMARQNFVHFTYAISPGLSMIYSSESEFQTLTRKLESIRELGVTDFALLLDDVPQDLVHPEDQARFKTLAAAHAYLINRLHDHLQTLSPQNRLTVCPTTYTNEWGNRDYLRELGATVKAEIPLDWTGTEVIPTAITVSQATEWASYIQRKPLLWDNFPVNDNHPWRLILDPLRGRQPELFTAIHGLFSNPMYQAHASLIPLQTVADFLWNPMAYDPQESREHALVSQFGPDGPALLAPILQIYDHHGEEPDFAAIFEERRSVIDVPAIQSQILLLDSAIHAMQARAQFAKLVPEIASLPDMVRAQLDRILNSPAFKHRTDGKIEWDREQHLLTAARLEIPPTIDGDFSKWQSEKVQHLNRATQIENGQQLWKGPEQFSADVAFAWDDHNLYVGVSVVDPHLYQPFTGRGVQNADVFRLILNTQRVMKPGRPVAVYDLYFSPGNFTDVQPSIYCDEDFFPPRPHPHDYSREIRTIWKKTAAGFSADIVVPASFFEIPRFEEGREIGLSFGAQKVLQPQDPSTEDVTEIVFTSKEDTLFSIEPQNPATLQQVELVGLQNSQVGSAGSSTTGSNVGH